MMPERQKPSAGRSDVGRGSASRGSAGPCPPPKEGSAGTGLVLILPATFQVLGSGRLSASPEHQSLGWEVPGQGAEHQTWESLAHPREPSPSLHVIWA